MKVNRGLTVGFCLMLFPGERLLLGGGPAGQLLPGDVNLDGRVSISDPVSLTLYLGLCCGEPPCSRAGDVDGNGQLQLSDAVAIYRFLFLGDAGLSALGQGCTSPVEASLGIDCAAENACVDATAAPPGAFEVFIATQPAAESAPESGIGLFGRPDEEFDVPFHVFLKDLSTDGDGVTAWSIGIQVEADSTTDASILNATTRGTFADATIDGGLFDGGFKQTAEAVPTGIVSEVSLSFISPTTLPKRGASPILRGTLRVRAPGLGQEATLFLRAVDGLTGPGRPVALEVRTTLQGPFTPASTPLKVFVSSPLGRGAFLRGDVNGDDSLDISDPITTLGVLFLGSSQLSCPDAADSNDDGRIDISDPVSSLGCLFLGGACPPAPYPTCGRDPTPDGLECDTLRFDCQ